MNSKDKQIKHIEIDMIEYLRDITSLFANVINNDRVTIDLNDGLKPVYRRILQSAFHGKLKTNKKKVATLMGDTMGKYHPHGDSTIYDAIVKMSRDWEYAYPLFQRLGNFGKADGDVAAAPRYISTKLSKFAWDCYFSELDREDDIIDYVPNFDSSCNEAKALPAKYPMALINQSEGIGFSTSSRIPSYNFNEVMKLTIKLIKDPQYRPSRPLIPDLVTGADVYGYDGMKSIWTSGTGTFYEIGRTEINDNIINIKCLPSRVTGLKFIEELKKLVIANKINGLDDYYNKSRDELLDISITVKAGYSPYNILDTIYRKTRLKTHFAAKINTVNNYQLSSENPISLLLKWIDFRRETKFRYVINKRSRLVTKKFLLEAKVDIIESNMSNNLLKDIKESENIDTIRFEMKQKYTRLSNMQINDIINMKVNSFSKSSLNNYKMELSEIDPLIDEYNNIIQNPDVMDKCIISELEEGMRKWGRPRRSKFIKSLGVDFVSDLNHEIVYSKLGYVKKLPDEKGTTTNIGTLEKYDYPVLISHVNNRDTGYLFDSTGRIYNQPINDIPPSACKGDSGVSLVNSIKMRGSFVTCNMINADDDKFIISLSERGMISKTPISEFNGLKEGKNVICMKLKKNDKLVDAITLSKDTNILVYTENGYCIKFSTKEITSSKRGSIGNIVMTVGSDDNVVGMSIVPNITSSYLITNANGNMKIVNNSSVNKRKRNASKISVIGRAEIDNPIISVLPLRAKDKLFNVYTSKKVYSCDIDSVPVQSSISGGTNVFAFNKSETIGFIKII